MNFTATPQGRLFYVIGASGAGKDSLIRHARAHFAATPAPSVFFAHRYITRPSDAGGEQHIAVSDTEFARLRDAGCFAMHWSGNGLNYGIGLEIEVWLARGLNVVVNGSRAYLDEAARRFPSMCPVLVEVSEDTLAARLLARGRETPGEIHARIERARALPRPEHPALQIIRNDGALATAGEVLLSLLQKPTQTTMRGVRRA